MAGVPLSMFHLPEIERDQIDADALRYAVEEQRARRAGVRPDDRGRVFTQEARRHLPLGLRQDGRWLRLQEGSDRIERGGSTVEDAPILYLANGLLIDTTHGPTFRPYRGRQWAELQATLQETSRLTHEEPAGRPAGPLSGAERVAAWKRANKAKRAEQERRRRQRLRPTAERLMAGVSPR
jgi:hypothetical protein